MPDEDDRDELATEGDRAWRERTQETNEQAEEIQPPHDPDAERENASSDR
ncbi:MAG: hypothetical protein ACRDM1_13045 [Gaiellaceae bacterium]